MSRFVLCGEVCLHAAGFVVGYAQIDTATDPVSVFEFAVHARDDVPAVRGDRVAVTVRDSVTDRISVGPASAPCVPGPAQELPVSRGGFRLQ